MKEIVINACYGGFSLSPLAVKEFAKLKGKECYFFKREKFCEGDYIPITLEEATNSGRFAFYSAFSIPNPNEVLRNKKDWAEMTMAERQSSNAKYEKYELDKRDIPRDDPDLIKIVKELGEKANGSCASLKIVEIPDNMEWEISEYDGFESVEEKHRSWS